MNSPLLLPDYNSGPALRSWLEERGLSIRKQWGQNFLINPSARRSLVDALDAKGEVWEIGSGPGCMTAELLNRGMRVTAFEIDPGLCPILEELFAPSGRFTLIRGDVLKTWKTAQRAPYLLGNLPYTIAALFMGNLIEDRCFFTRMVVTVQKEVALRMAAPPGSKDYSSISVLCASAYTMKIIMTLKPPSFYPVPHVDSAAVCFEKRAGAPFPPPFFYPLIRALFASRRKTTANNLQNFLVHSGTLKEKTAAEQAAAVLKGCGISGRERAEKLPPETFFALAAELEKYVGTGDDHKRTDRKDQGTD
ncbi:MAG: 16S rRNA (adenine(1518)-N(6)/adenine(1519)-N(6))-dimethyltransferase RsmA [Treponema sp.]|nr:16S rRNA (adenine(1518)-N(6)/adenine(1519)-N(6))-dimethyltransferase RsmA [Treponema sp.]